MDKLKTVVSFYTHSTLEESRIVDVIEIDGHSSIGIITQETPFHPENFKWKDQPSDRGQIQLNNQVLQIEKALIFCSKKGRLLIGDDINGLDLQDKEIPFGVIHIVNNRPSTLNIKNFIGQTVTLSVDQDYRESLSMAHTASHLVALALNNTLSQCWKKEHALDCLGNKDFDQAAISYSNITLFCSIDRFRLGKSTKRRGVDIQYIVNNIN